MRFSRRGVITGAAALIAAPACAAAPAHAAAPVPRVAMLLAHGTVLIDLFTHQAPVSATDFLRYADARYYDGGSFTRTVRADNDHGAARIDVVQGGIRQGVKPFPPVAHETTLLTGIRHLDGTISLPRDTPGTGSGAEFFICIGAQSSLDFGGRRNPDGKGFAAFGRVVSGMDLIREIWRMDATGPSPDAYTAGQMITRPPRIISVRRV
jgi:peptidyl-prolyl cis-trans isomerase A (cyclophilin A)